MKVGIFYVMNHKRGERKHPLTPKTVSAVPSTSTSPVFGVSPSPHSRLGNRNGTIAGAIVVKENVDFVGATTGRPRFVKEIFGLLLLSFYGGWTGDQWSPLRESVCFSYPVCVWRSFRLSEVHETGAQRNTNPVGATTGRPLLRSVLRWRQTRQKTLPYGSRGTMRSGIGVTEGGRRRTNIRGGVA